MVSFRTIASRSASAFAVAAAAFALPAQAQVGGGIYINDSDINGAMTATGVRGSVVTGSGIGANNWQNGYGNYSSITANVNTTGTMLDFGAFFARNSTLKGNIAATGVNGSVVDSSCIGYSNTCQNVGQVTQVSATVNSVAPTNLAVIGLTGVQLPAGDGTATGLNNSIVADSVIGASSLVNNYGGYTSTTADVKGYVPAASGVVSIDNSALPASNVTATSVDTSVVATSAIGYNNAQRSVGSVVKFTANATSLGLQPN